MRYTLFTIGLMSALLLGCQDHKNNEQKIDSPVTNASSQSDTQTDSPTKNVESLRPLTIDEIIKDETVDFVRVQGHYPIFLDTAYQSLNDNIQKHIDDLIKFDNSISTETTIGGVDKLEYLVLNFDDNQLSLQMDYHLNDMTARYFERFYQIDLKNKRQVLLADFLKENAVNVDELNKAINDYTLPCKNIENRPEYCQNIASDYLLNLFEFDNETIDILQHSDSFYIVDKEHIVVAFNSTKFTTKLKINIKTYKIDFN